MANLCAIQAQYAVASYNDVRSEIRERLGYRDKWIGQYVFGTVTFIGVSLGIEKIDITTKILLCLIMPMASLIVAINVSAHVKSIESCANFVRYKLNPLFAVASVPNWDGHTLKLRENEDNNEKSRNKRRQLTNAISLHLPSFLSLLFAAYLIHQGYRFEYELRLPVPIILFYLTIGVFLTAIKVTWKSFDDRLKVPNFAEEPTSVNALPEPPASPGIQ